MNDVLPPTGPGGALGPGVLLDGKYEILSLLGAGGMGEVYKARHLHLGAFRCIKVMKAAIMADDSNRSRFLREARLATQIHHSNVAVVHDFSVAGDGTAYMVTEFIAGTTVRQWSASHGRFPVPLAADVALQVLDGLDAIHRRGLLHRDISADNIMLAWDEDDRLIVKIIDLGVAKDIGAVSDTTQVGMLIGNPKYMSPEQLGQLAEGEQLDGRCDLYSFGVVLYEMLRGVPPFVSRTPSGYIMQHLTEQPAPLRGGSDNPSLPAPLEAAVLRALAKNRNHRWGSAKEFASALRPYRPRFTERFTQNEAIDLMTGEATVVLTPAPRKISDEEAFATASENGAASAFESFLLRYPTSPLVPVARERLQEAREFEGLTETLPGLRAFVARWPEGVHRFAVELRLAELEEREGARAWESALAADSYAAFRAFRTAFPALHVHEAEERIAERMAFDQAAAIDTEEAWTEYLDRYGDDAHAPRAVERLEAARTREETAFTAGMEAKSAEAWQAYLDEFPDGKRSARAEANRLEALAFAAAKLAGLEGLREFVHHHPDGVLLHDAQREIGLIEAEPRDFEAAWESGNSAAWDEYLARYPSSPRLLEARRCRQEAVEFELATTMNTATMWRAFVKAWPEGRHRLDAELRLR
ncbi:MAG TPA: protein kinase [Thermoanaerobaculia bacterium]|jgi:serine/threonine protein kinase